MYFFQELGVMVKVFGTLELTVSVSPPFLYFKMEKGYGLPHWYEFPLKKDKF